MGVVWRFTLARVARILLECETEDDCVAGRSGMDPRAREAASGGSNSSWAVLAPCESPSPTRQRSAGGICSDARAYGFSIEYLRNSRGNIRMQTSTTPSVHLGNSRVNVHLTFSNATRWNWEYSKSTRS